MKESVTIAGVTVDVSSGDIVAAVGNLNNNYKINVSCSKFGITAYSDPISLFSLWKSKDGGIARKNNTGKVFTIPYEKSESLVTQMKSGNSIINTTGEGTIAGISGTCKVKLTKK